MKDPYSVLGVTKNTSPDEIRNAYRSIAKKNHPDLNPGNKEREEKFKEAAAAYEKIGTPEARARFDSGETDEAFSGAKSRPFYREAQNNSDRYSYSYGSGGLDDDFFESLFRQGGAGRQKRATDYPGEDELYQMTVEFYESALGSQREITLANRKKLEIRIPPRVESGARLRFKGLGGPGIGKGPPGDAYVEVHVRPLAGYTKKGKDIETEVAVTFYEALLGGEIQVPTIEGLVSLALPPGVSSGSRLRVRGKGIASAKGEARGDQIVSLKVVMPKDPPPELIKAAAEWKEKFAYLVREEK